MPLTLGSCCPVVVVRGGSIRRVRGSVWSPSGAGGQSWAAETLSLCSHLGLRPRTLHPHCPELWEAGTFPHKHTSSSGGAGYIYVWTRRSAESEPRGYVLLRIWTIIRTEKGRGVREVQVNRTRAAQWKWHASLLHIEIRRFSSGFKLFQRNFQKSPEKYLVRFVK